MQSIMVIDDDAADRKHIRRMLRQANYDATVVEATSIVEALDLVATQDVGCMIVDYYMPDLNGLEGITKLREKASGIPIIMVTGQGDEIIASQAYQAGVSDYISKKVINANSIVRSIRNSMEKNLLMRRIEEQNASLRVFSHVLAHDLKSPLTTQYGSAQLLRLVLDAGDIGEAVGLCEEIERSCERMTKLINAVSAYNNCVTTGLEHERVSMNAVFDDAIADLAAYIDAHKAIVTREDLPDVMGVHPRLVQLLQNLISNAIKYCTTSPVVRVSTRRTDVGFVFVVADNGIGISEEERGKVFDPFQRAIGAKDYDGTGLGLATCRTIVDQHNGRIWCRPGKSGGTEFCFTLD